MAWNRPAGTRMIGDANMIRTIFATFLLVGAACATAADQDEIPIVEIRNAGGDVVARAILWPANNGVEVRVQAAGLPHGQYGVHIHATGRCDAPGYESAGGHWNPAGRQHGKLNPQGHHLGDLDNLVVNADGGRLEFAIAGATLHGGEAPIVDADGAAIVIHADPDDYRTDPSGNSGARIACGTLR
jgi:superoxide dismutase, Cu-Zn family